MTRSTLSTVPTVPTIRTVDACQAVLQEYGWSAGDVAYRLNNAVVWQVYAHKQDQRIVVRAATQLAAWTAAGTHVAQPQRSSST